MVQGIVRGLSEYVRIVEEIHFTHIRRRMIKIKPSIGNDNDNREKCRLASLCNVGPMNKEVFFITSIGEEGSFMRKRTEELFDRIIEPACNKCGYKEKIARPGGLSFCFLGHCN
jgi:hypothetical protein